MDDCVMQIRGPLSTWRLRRPGELRGRHLRYLLTTLLREAGEALTVAELVARCEREGVAFSGRASKIVSDALRWEIGWGRVKRLGRGVYAFDRVPKSTRRWIGGRVGDIRVYLARLRMQPGQAIIDRSEPARVLFPFVI